MRLPIDPLIDLAMRNANHRVDAAVAAWRACHCDAHALEVRIAWRQRRPIYPVFNAAFLVAWKAQTDAQLASLGELLDDLEPFRMAAP